MNMNFILMMRGLRQDSLKLLGVVLDSKLTFTKIWRIRSDEGLTLETLAF